MQFRFNEDQNELRQQARRFLTAVSGQAQVDAAMKTELGYDPAVWGRVVEELGWPALTIPDEYDGIGMSYADLHPLLEEMGRHVFCSPFFSTVCLGVNALLTAGSHEQKQEHLPNIAIGETTATVAYTEPNGRWDATGIEATFTKDGGDYVLRGEKAFVIDGASAGLVVVAARAEGSTGAEGVTLFLVPGDADKLSREAVPTMDQTRRLAKLALDGVRVPESARLGDEGAGWAALERTVDLAMIGLSAEQVGGAEMCLDMSVEYAKVRKQFGRAIGSFQAIKHKCADMLMRAESARSASFYASALASEEGADIREAASSAKAYASDAYFFCAGESIQIHGGIGFTWEHAAHLYFKRAQSSQTMFGKPRLHRERVAQLIGL